MHGYSETALGAYQHLPELLNAAGYDTIVLSAFDSLDDFVTISDLADALEMRVADLEATGFDVRDTSLVCHSTGALIARRWILNRRANATKPKDAVLPARLVTLAGANHGSTLAELGKSPLGYVEKLITDHVVTVGKQVLTDLDYGSDFLRRLSIEWMAAWNDADCPLSEQVLAFSLGGDFIGNNPALKLLWATSESGSDNTVRISGANLNYTILEADPDANPPRITPRTLARRVPHLILRGYSHFDTDTGILHAADRTDAAFLALLTALQTTAAGYDALAQSWKAQNDAWSGEKPADANSTIIFNLCDQFSAAIPDCMIAFWDEADIDGDPRDVTLPLQRAAGAYAPPQAETPEEAAVRKSVITASLSSADSILPHSPIHNNVALGSYSFYLNYPKWVGNGSRHHCIYIEAVSDTPYILYRPTIYRPSVDINRLIQPNQSTYVNVTLKRNPDKEFAFYTWATDFGPDARKAAVWPPFPTLPNRVPARTAS
jgi:hypothetical protein